MFRFRHLDARGLVYKCSTTRPECFTVVPTLAAPPNAAGQSASPAAAAGGGAAAGGAAAAAPAAASGSGSGSAASDPWLGAELSVEVSYEGVAVGDTAAELHISSEVGGAFVVPLLASCR